MKNIGILSGFIAAGIFGSMVGWWLTQDVSGGQAGIVGGALAFISFCALRKA